MIPIVSIVGRSKAGKTTLVVKLIKELKSRGYRVGVIKHDAHGFEIDYPGKDSWLHREAGADIVTISSSSLFALVEKLTAEISLDEIIARIENVDLILTEGYKSENKPKIEVFRSPRSEKLYSKKEDLIALATNKPFKIGVPEFSLEDSSGLADLIEELFLKASLE
ncbi:MAG: molybdopterin-guanine dinucleotide biosynthesis protein B [Bacillota bacterium]